MPEHPPSDQALPLDAPPSDQRPRLLSRVGDWSADHLKLMSPHRQIAPGSHITIADGAKSAFVVFVGGVCPFVILGILTISAGYFFNGLRPLSNDVQSLVAYGTALIVELVNLALFFVSARAFWSEKRAHFITALLIGIALTLISIVAQVLYLSTNLNAASLGQGTTVLQDVPLVGSLATTGLIIVTRALALHLAEFACCYVIARSSVNHRKLIQAQQETLEAELALLEAEQYALFKRGLHQAQMAQLEAISRFISVPGHPISPEEVRKLVPPPTAAKEETGPGDQPF